MVTKNTILYVGNDKTFFEDLLRFDNIFWPLNPSTMVQVMIQNDWPYSIHDQVFTNMPKLIFIDFSDDINLKIINQMLFDFLLFIKKHPVLKRTPICGTFLSEKQLDDNKNLFFCGLSYAFVKGDLYTTLFEDSYYLAFEDKIAFPQYAIASNINLDYQLEMPIVVKNMNAEKITIESDISINEDDIISGTFNFFDDFTGKIFSVARQFQLSCRNFYLASQDLFIKYAEPWDEVTEDSFLKETVETWVDFNREQYPKLFPTVSVVNDKKLFVHDLVKSNLSQECDLLFNYEFENQFLNIKNNRPAMITFELNEDELTEDEAKLKSSCRKNYLPNDISTFMLLISYIRGIEYYKPIIIIFNCYSRTDAMQKASDYKNILAHNESMTSSTIIDLVKFYQTNKKTVIDRDYLSIPPFSKKSYATIDLPVKITSLTEHEITFLTTYNLPLFSILKLKEPFDMYLTIVPSIRDLKIVPNFHHYMAFIGGVSETKLPVLRQFITQLIDRPPKEFKFYPNEVVAITKEVTSTELVREKPVERVIVQWIKTEGKMSKL